MLVEQSLRIRDLTVYESDVLNELLVELANKSKRNDLRSKYYAAKETVKHLGISIPPQLQSIETVIGWPAKAVDDLEQRIDLDGFVIPGATAADFGIDRIWDDNRLALESSQAHSSALKYAVSFVSVLAGDVSQGEPEVIVRPLSAMSSTALWDSVRRRVSAALTITGADNNSITEFILFTDTHVLTCSRNRSAWTVERVPHILGRCPVAVLPYKPNLESPFGTSRISRAVMSITDRAIRSLLRMEVSAEFYSSPQRYVLGADEDQFVGANGEAKTGWEVTLGKLLALGTNEDGNTPTVGQFPQLTMQPHMDMVRSDAALFSGESGIPVNSLGIIHDNPSSDAAMQTAYLPLVKSAERAHIPFGIGWVDAMKMAVQVRDNLSSPPEELVGMKAKFRNPATSTRTEAANATALFIQAFPWAAESEVALEMFGVDQTDLTRLLADKRRAQAGSRLSELLAEGQRLRAEANGDDSTTSVGVSVSEPVLGSDGATGS